MPTVEPTASPALCKLLEYDGDQAVVEVNTGTMIMPRVGFEAMHLRAAYLEPGMEFVWFMDPPRKEAPPRISRVESTVALAKGRIELMGMISEEDRELDKFKAVPDSVVREGAMQFQAFAQAGTPMMDERYFRLFDQLVKMLEPYDLLKKYRDVLLDRMIVRGREACAERMREIRASSKATPVFCGKYEVKEDPPVVIGEPVPSYTAQYAAMSRFGRIKLRLRLMWRCLFGAMPTKTADREHELEAACRYTLAQEFDDVCWLDFYTKIAKILGVEYDPKLLPRARFLGNCGRFYDSMAAGQPYQRDPSKECSNGSDGSVEGCGRGQPGRPVPGEHRHEGGG